MPEKMEQTFAREFRSLRKIKLGQYITKKIKRTISTNYILKWKKSPRGKLKARMGSKPRW